VVLSTLASTVELLAEASGPSGTARRWVKSPDGMAAEGFALAAMAEALLEQPQWIGARVIDQVCALEPVVARVNALAGRMSLELSLRVSGAQEATRVAAPGAGTKKGES
jgi:hypothetical protein